MAPRTHAADRSASIPILLGVCVPLGWVLFDVAVFLSTRRPAEATRLLAGGCVAIGVGAAFGALFHVIALGWRSLAGLALILGLFTLWPGMLARLGLGSSAADFALPRFLLLALLVWWGALEAGRRVRISAPHLGLAGGVLLAAAHTLLASDGVRIPRSLVLAAVPLLALAFTPPSRRRLVLTLVVVVAPAAYLARAVRLNERWLEPDLAPPTATARPGAPNALLIVLDTVRPDHMSAYGYERDTTPGLAAFANEHATRYTRAYSTSPWTLPAHASLFTGLYPAQHGATRNRASEDPPRPYPVRPELPTLAERLRSGGYRTGAILSNNVLGRWSGLDRGFEHYDDRKSGQVGDYLAFAQFFGAGELAGHKPYRDGRVITDLALEWLDGNQRDAPFFLALNYMDAHAPYSPEPPFDSLFEDARPANPTDPEEVELWPLLYDRELAYMDAHVARLFDGLGERGLFENTLVIVTSDHGEAFGEHDIWSHEWALYEEFVRVPLLVKPAGGRREKENDTELTSADVHDLVLTELGVALDEPDPAANADDLVAEWYYSEGVQLPPGFPGTPRSERMRDLVALRAYGLKLIVSSTGEVEAFDLEADPGERAPIALEDDVREAALERARVWWAAHPPPDPGTSGATDAEALERLENLGYAGGD